MQTAGPSIEGPADFAVTLVEPPCQGFKLFLDPKLLTLQFLHPEIVRSQASAFILYLMIEVPVPHAQFADTGFYRHGVHLHVDGQNSRRPNLRSVSSHWLAQSRA